MQQDAFNKIIQLLEAKDPQAALDAVEERTASGEMDSDLQFLKGRSLLALKDFERSATVFLDVLKKTPEFTYCLLPLCEVFCRLGKFGAAIACLSKAIQQDPDNVSLHKFKSRLYESQIRKNKAGSFKFELQRG